MASKPPRRSSSKQVDENMPAPRIINKLGGLKRFCEESAHVREGGKPFSTSTVWSWMTKGLIPIAHTNAVKAVAQRMRVKIKDSDFFPDAG
jgi:hypothetical protein